MLFSLFSNRPLYRTRSPRFTGRPSSMLRTAAGRTIALLPACAIVHTSLPAASCSDYFEGLTLGASGACADIAFFGFDGTGIDEFGFTNGGRLKAAIDLFDEPGPLPGFFTPAAETFADVQLKSLGQTGLNDFVIAHRGAVGMLPLATPPPAGMSSNRFIATGSENRTVFTAHHPAPGTQTIPVEITLEQNLELVDPVGSKVETRIGASFLLKATSLNTGIPLENLRGAAHFDSADGPDPEFGEPFSPDPGYQGFTTSIPGEAGLVRVQFNRTLELEIEEGSEIELQTIVRRHVFASGFDPGGPTATTASRPSTFNFSVKSPEPGITFGLRLEEANSALVVPSLDVDRLADDRIRLSWEAVAAQEYIILFTTDLSLPATQWEERETVTATSGTVERDFPANGLSGFFALRTAFP